MIFSGHIEQNSKLLLLDIFVDFAFSILVSRLQIRIKPDIHLSIRGVSQKF